MVFDISKKTISVNQLLMEANCLGRLANSCVMVSDSLSVEESLPQQQRSHDFFFLGHSALANNPEVVKSGSGIRLRHSYFRPTQRAHTILSKETSTETGTCPNDCSECHLKLIAERLKKSLSSSKLSLSHLELKCSN